jgi:hypothetical protein
MTRVLRILMGLILLDCFSGSFSNAQDTGIPQNDHSILRCDPAIQIKMIDDQPRNESLAPFRDCAIDLTPGEHKVTTCYEHSGMSAAGPGSVMYSTWKCDKTKEVIFVAEPRHIYRLKLELMSDWRAWIKDVTLEELHLPLGTEERPRDDKKAGGKKESWLLARITPTYMKIGFVTGNTRGIWFFKNAFGDGIMKPKGSSKEFVLRKVKAGDTLGLMSAQFVKDFKFKLGSPCGENKTQVLEDIPGGRVLYLGELSLEDVPTGFDFKVSHDDLNGAREFLEREYPELAGQLEVAEFRMLRTPYFCEYPGHELSNAS